MGFLEDAVREYGRYLDRTDDPQPPPADRGLIYFKGGKLHTIDDAGTVVEYGAGGDGGGDGGLVLLDEYDVSTDGATTAITFSGIGQGYRHLLVEASLRGDGGGGTTNTIVRVGNGGVDTGSNYAWNTSVIGDSSSSTSWQVHRPAAGTGAPSGRLGWFQMWVFRYADDSLERHMRLEGFQPSTAIVHSAGRWNNTADPIDTLSVIHSDSPSDGWILGDVQLYGVPDGA